MDCTRALVETMPQLLTNTPTINLHAELLPHGINETVVSLPTCSAKGEALTIDNQNSPSAFNNRRAQCLGHVWNSVAPTCVGVIFSVPAEERAHRILWAATELVTLTASPCNYLWGNVYSYS